LTSLRELSFGHVQLKLHNKKKAKTSFRYHGSGAFSVEKMTPIKEPVLQTATGYTIRCMITDFITYDGENPRSTTLSVRGTPLDTDKEQLIYQGVWDDTHSFTVTLPFEAVKSLDAKLTFNYYKVHKNIMACVQWRRFYRI
jgi:hypothetical protein